MRVSTCRPIYFVQKKNRTQPVFQGFGKYKLSLCKRTFPGINN